MELRQVLIFPHGGRLYRRLRVSSPNLGAIHWWMATINSTISLDLQTFSSDVAGPGPTSKRMVLLG